MSVNSLANAAAARRPEMVPLETVPQGFGEIARASATSPTTNPQPPTGAVSKGDPAQIDTALNVLFGYIPTEVLTLYVAVLAAVHQSDGITPAERAVFWIFLVVTPLVVWLVYSAKVKAAGEPLPIRWGVLPIWEMVAATIAFSAWALALPNNPLTEYAWYSAGLSGVAVLVASTTLGLLTPFFQTPLTVSKAQPGQVVPN